MSGLGFSHCVSTLMRIHLIILVAASIFFLLPLQKSFAAETYANQDDNLGNIELPTALEEELFNDLPFEQLRQSLREEINNGSPKTFSPHTPQKLNWLIR